MMSPRLNAPPKPSKERLRASAPSFRSVTRQWTQSMSLCAVFTGSNGVKASSVPSTSIFTLQPGLSKVSIVTPKPCSQSASQCAEYHCCSQLSSSDIGPNYAACFSRNAIDLATIVDNRRYHSLSHSGGGFARNKSELSH